MQLYEANFGRLMRLAPNLSCTRRSASTRAPGLPDLHLEVVEHCIYTTTILLSRHSQQGGQSQFKTGIAIRVYYVMRGWLALQPSARGADERWQRNRRLERWLSERLLEGYRFYAEASLEQDGCCQRLSKIAS
jgi:hypothetical protein